MHIRHIVVDGGANVSGKINPDQYVSTCTCIHGTPVPLGMYLVRTRLQHGGKGCILPHCPRHLCLRGTLKGPLQRVWEGPGCLQRLQDAVYGRHLLRFGATLLEFATEDVHAARKHVCGEGTHVGVYMM